MSEWISVHVGLPEIGKSVLVLLMDGNFAVATLERVKQSGNHDWEPDGVYATYDGCGGVALYCKPEFWMELPEEPK